jgi:hypothetical protein
MRDLNQDSGENMNMKKAIAMVGLAVISAMGMTSVAAAQSALDGQSPSRGNAKDLVGAWRTVVTQRSCQTNEALATLPGLFTFNDGGTMAEYGIGPGSSPALRSPGHGTWEREHGWRDYSFAFTFYRYNASGAFVGSTRVTGVLELGSSGDDFATRSSIEVLDVNDAVIATGCGTTVGRRFE